MMNIKLHQDLLGKEHVIEPRTLVALIGDTNEVNKVIDHIIDSISGSAKDRKLVSFYSQSGSPTDPREVNFATVLPIHTIQREKLITDSETGNAFIRGLAYWTVKNFLPGLSGSFFTNYDLPKGMPVLEIIAGRFSEDQITDVEEVCRHFNLIEGETTLRDFLEAVEKYPEYERRFRTEYKLTFGKRFKGQVHFRSRQYSGLELLQEKPEELSREYQFYTALARAILKKPDLILVSAPAEGHRYPDVLQRTTEKLKGAQEKGNFNVIYATPDKYVAKYVAKYVDRVIEV